MIKIPSIEEMIEKSEIPNYIEEFVDRLKTILRGDDFKNIFKDFFKTKINDINSMIKIVPQGSYDRDTSSYYFKKIEKSDIDLILLIDKNIYILDLKKLKVNVPNQKFENKYFDEITNNIFWYDTFDNIRVEDLLYIKPENMQKFKKTVFELLKNKLNYDEIKNKTKTIEIKKGSLNIDLSIGCNFEIDLKKPSNELFLNNFKNYNKLISVNKEKYFTILGVNIFTSEGYKQNTPYLNKINVNEKNVRTKGSFCEYVIFFKNLVKFAKHNNIQFKLSSHTIESILYSMHDSWFKQILGNNKESKRYLLDIVERFILKDKKGFVNIVEFNNRYKETNEIVKLSNIINYYDVVNDMNIINQILIDNYF